MLLSLLLLTASPVTDPTTDVTEEPSCSYDMDAMLALDLNAFDQDLNGGWRTLSTSGCDLEAADLIRDWRYQKRQHASILYWHEGQIRAIIGQTDEAIALFNLTYKAPELDADFGWNHYVSGTIAFLRRDRDALESSIAALLQLPKPEGLEDTVTMADGTVLKFDWPPNLNVLEGFENCWDQSYSEVYGNKDCKTKVAEGS